jgi:ADP-ribosylglycohydrolase
VLGTVLGDAIGGPFEFGPLERVPALTGGDWIDGLYPYPAEMGGPHGVWKPPSDAPSADSERAPAGTGTDDTRLNWLFLELACDLGRMPGAREVAERYLELYEHPERAFPSHAKMTRLQFEHWEPVCRGYLGQRSTVFPDLPPDVLLARALGLNFPILSGLIAWTWAGLLYPGQPEAAYEAVFRADFYDIGYAREAVGLLAAAIGVGVVGEGVQISLYEALVEMDPLHLGSEWSAPYVAGHLPQYVSLVRPPAPSCAPTGAPALERSDPEIAHTLSVAFRRYHPFGAFRTFAVALLSVLAVGTHGDDVGAHGHTVGAHGRAPVRAILIAANHTGINDEGQPTRYEDIDCYAALAGALGGALWGAEAFPGEMLEQVVEANKQVYGIDLEATIERFIETFFE